MSYSLYFKLPVHLSNSPEEISEACDKATPPTLTQFDQWGRRVDILHTSEGWRKLKDISQEEGIIGIFYERKYGEFSRLYGFAKEMLAGFVGAEVDRLAETKGMDEYDKIEAKRHAERSAENMYDQHYRDADQYNPQQYDQPNFNY